MGKRKAGADDEFITKRAGTLSAAGSSPWTVFMGPFNVTLTGLFAGKAQLERSFDAGETACPITNGAGKVVVFDGPASDIQDEPESGVLYRVTVTELTSGTVTYRLSK